MKTFHIRGRKNESFSIVEVLKLRGNPGARNILNESYSFPEDGIESAHECSNEEIQELEKLWNSLPEGEQARCHIPGFAIRVRNNHEVDFIATICWECNNIYLAGRLSEAHCLQFNAKSSESQSLLKFCKCLFQ